MPKKLFKARVSGEEKETYYIQYPPTGGFWKLLNTPKPPETTCWGVQDVFA